MGQGGAAGGAPGGMGRVVLLSVMMFLQFFVWGAWFVTLGPFMGALEQTGTSTGNAYTMAPIAAILAPLFLGILADRFFPSQIVMGVLHILGGVLLMLAPGQLTAGGDPTTFIALVLGHMLCYMPTLGLSNTVAFHAMTNPEKQFPLVRVWGTIGWIVAGIAVGYLATTLVTETPDRAGEALTRARAASPHYFYVAGGAAVLLGLFSFVLPNTPAPMKGKPFQIGAALGLDAIQLLRDRNFLVFIVGSLLICIPLAAYYQQAANFAGATGVKNVPFTMTYGQMSEILFMLVMPLFFARLGVKWMLAVGMLAWVVRYGLFAGAWNDAGGHIMGMVIAGIILHGICYDFFFVTGQIYTEQRAPKQIRAQAQGFLVLITQGIGMLIGNQVFGRLVDRYTTTATDGTKTTDWQTVWLWPTGFALAILVLFVLLFSGKRRPNGGGLGDVQPATA